MAEPLIFVQVEPVVAGVSPQAKSTAFVEIKTEQLEKVRELIELVSQNVAAKITKDELSPAELTVEFGIGLKGDASIPFLAKAGVEANFKVTAKWHWSEAK
jgi:hypothetical protein